MDVIQPINQSGNALQVVQRGNLLLPGIRMIDIQGSPACPRIHSLPTEEYIVLLISTTEADLRRGGLNKLHHPLLRKTRQSLFPVNPRPRSLEQLQRRL
ncbi:MAG: hypothetical protein DDT25_01176 [Chloroflexi bacterium]|nr:hypothetical protein [Chloroflexota bacterium]